MLKEMGAGMQKKMGEILKFLPLNPNQITTIALILAIAGAYYTYEKDIFGPILIFIAFFLDVLDGAVARARGEATKFGAYLDGINDRLVEFFALLPLFFDSMLMVPALLILFFGTCMHSFSKAYASHRKVMGVGAAAGIKSVMARAERVAGILIVLVLFVVGHIVWAYYLIWVIAIISILAFILLQFRVYGKVRG
ncbi:MAG: CDP-alcohol phosphatidyltransferase family protein [Candidatus Micrarchaeota archaeon]